MLNIEKIERPNIEDLREKYRGLLERIDEDIDDENLKKSVENFIIELEWNDLYRDQIEKKSGKKMSVRQKRDAYAKFFKELVDSYRNVVPYLKSDPAPALDIPLRKPDISKELRKILVDHPRVLEAIERLYPFEKKRRNKEELRSAATNRILKMANDIQGFLNRKKWKRIEGVTNKRFIFKRILPGRCLHFFNEDGDMLPNIIKCQICTLDGNTIFQEGRDYTVNYSFVVIKKPLVDVAREIEVTITTKCQKYRIVNSDLFSVIEYSDC